MLSIKKVLNWLKGRLFRSEQYQHELMVTKWYAEGEDYGLRFNYDLNEKSLVFDLGGYEGQWSSDLFARYQCQIFIFEPVNSFANRINGRFAKNDKLQVYQFGLGGVSRFQELSIAADGSSIFGKTGNKEKIELVDAKDWIEKNLGSDQSIDLMKINIEGGEYELLDRLIETKLVNRIKNIQVQLHKISQNSLSHMERIQAGLMKTHEPTYQYKFVWENWKLRSIG